MGLPIITRLLVAEPRKPGIYVFPMDSEVLAKLG